MTKTRLKLTAQQRSDLILWARQASGSANITSQVIDRFQEVYGIKLYAALVVYWVRRAMREMERVPVDAYHAQLLAELVKAGRFASNMDAVHAAIDRLCAEEGHQKITQQGLG